MHIFLSLKSLSCKILFTLITAQDMIIKGTLIANDIDIKGAISVEITVTGVFISLRSLIGILIVIAMRNGYNHDYNQQPSNASSTLISFPGQ